MSPKISTGPVVEMLGDEMTRIIWVRRGAGKCQTAHEMTLVCRI